jgi:hypothetical protein
MSLKHAQQLIWPVRELETRHASEFVYGTWLDAPGAGGRIRHYVNSSVERHFYVCALLPGAPSRVVLYIHVCTCQVKHISSCVHSSVGCESILRRKEIINEVAVNSLESGALWIRFRLVVANALVAPRALPAASKLSVCVSQRSLFPI